MVDDTTRGCQGDIGREAAGGEEDGGMGLPEGGALFFEKDGNVIVGSVGAAAVGVEGLGKFRGEGGDDGVVVRDADVDFGRCGMVDGDVRGVLDVDDESDGLELLAPLDPRGVSMCVNVVPQAHGSLLEDESRFRTEERRRREIRLRWRWWWRCGLLFDDRRRQFDVRCERLPGFRGHRFQPPGMALLLPLLLEA